MQRTTRCSSRCASTSTGWILTTLNAMVTAAIGTGTYYARQATSAFCTNSAESAGRAINDFLAQPLNSQEIQLAVNVNSNSHINTTVNTPYGEFPISFDFNLSDHMNVSAPLPFTSIGDILNWLFNTNVNASIINIKQTTKDKCHAYLPDLVTIIGEITTAYTLLQTINMAYVTYALNHRKQAADKENNSAMRSAV